MKRLIIATTLAMVLSTPTPSQACFEELGLFLLDVDRSVDRLLYDPPGYRAGYIEPRRARRHRGRR